MSKNPLAKLTVEEIYDRMREIEQEREMLKLKKQEIDRKLSALEAESLLLQNIRDFLRR